MKAVEQAWVDAIVALDGDRLVATRSARELTDRYREADRHYHGLAHIEQVLRDVLDLAHQTGIGPDSGAELVLAACGHDVVYDGRPGADEAASAEWARAALRIAGVGAGSVARVGDLILATTDHDPDPLDTVALILMDADLAVLAAEEPDYERYRTAVRREYAHVSDQQWRQGRAAVLQGLLAHERLYRTPVAFRRWEQSARANVRRELDDLQP
ncbi:hypothetical protein M6D93_09640 [Jatrophihabitans telluris]|uniref:Metal-dependent phosphohydrolase n=1 Tax=Jatrophihabitans telluris TaxID=2038343 RepID=A0ABY4R458_9ACTN|nr:hypothetical protein [Jatrophihabitans telluris]UQX90242.1 hypothetical protein M6D93_09640 [Jatrophihabitans telluris]